MPPQEHNFPNEKSNRIVLFADLRDSTEILINFEEGIYQNADGGSESDFNYEQFIFDLHETTYKELYLGHEETYAEIYGDGVMGVFPEDNTKYIIENIYRLTNRMQMHNSAAGVGTWRPKIDVGFGVTVGRVNFAHYPLDGRGHAVGQCIHEAARIERLSKSYGARILISHRFFHFAEGFLTLDPRFSYRFIDRVVLKGFQEPLTLFELLLDNDPRFKMKTGAIQAYADGYSNYCEKKWKNAKRIFLGIYEEHGLEIGAVMAKRCGILEIGPPNEDWNGVWRFEDK